MKSKEKTMILGGCAGVALLASLFVYQKPNVRSAYVEAPEPSVDALHSVQSHSKQYSSAPKSVGKQPQQEGALKSVNEELLALKAALGQLLSEQEALRKRLSTLPEYANEDAYAEQHTEAYVEKSPDEIQQEMDERLLMLEASLHAEPVDKAWADETLASLTEGFTHSELADVKMVDAACGSTLCRVEVQLDPGKPKEENLQKLAMHRTWDGPTFVAVDATGNTQLYFAREGAELPN